MKSTPDHEEKRQGAGFLSFLIRRRAGSSTSKTAPTWVQYIKEHKVMTILPEHGEVSVDKKKIISVPHEVRSYEPWLDTRVLPSVFTNRRSHDFDGQSRLDRFFLRCPGRPS